jgi:hypothetical protein
VSAEDDGTLRADLSPLYQVEIFIRISAYFLNNSYTYPDLTFLVSKMYLIIIIIQLFLHFPILLQVIA